MLLALIALGALAFLLQRPSYVLGEYRHWIATRIGDNRRLYKPEIAPRDLWMVLRFVHLSISERMYQVIQLLGAALIAAVCLFGRLRQWPENRLLIALYTLVSCWMLLLGPATESATYILLAPAMVLALIQAFEQKLPLGLRAMAVASLVVLLIALSINSFTKHREYYWMVVQPIGALIFTGFAVIWLSRAEYWTKSGSAPPCAQAAR